MDAQNWDISDDLWRRVEPLVPVRKRIGNQYYQRQEGGGRRSLEPRRVFAAIIHVLKTKTAWRELPKEYGSASSIHSYFKEWERTGFFAKLWRKGLAEHEDMGGIAWEWQPEVNDEKSPSPSGQRNRLARRREWRPVTLRRQRQRTDRLDFNLY